MAGISITLKKILKDETYTSQAKGYLYSTFAIVGPWLSTIIIINFLTFVVEMRSDVTLFDKQFLIASVVYILVFSQIIVAPWQLLLTRYMADKIYEGRLGLIKPSFNGLTKVVYSLATGFVLIYLFARSPMPYYYNVIVFILFTESIGLWIVTLYISALKDYITIGKSYMISAFVSVVSIFLLLSYPIQFPEHTFIMNGLIAITIGTTINFGYLTYFFMNSTPKSEVYEYDFMRYFNKLPIVFFIGLFYFLGLWIDNFIMWGSRINLNIADFIFVSVPYDTATFFAFVTVIPTTVIFVVSIETDFYELYKKYFFLVTHGGTFREIDDARIEMREVLTRKLVSMFQVQVIISFLVIYFADTILNFLGFDGLVVDIFRIKAIGAAFHAFVYIFIILFLYFEQRGRAFTLVTVFLVLNLIATYLSLDYSVYIYGIGFMFAAISTFLIGTILFNHVFEKMNYHVFAEIPIYDQVDKGYFVNLADFLNKSSEFKSRHKFQYRIKEKENELDKI